MLLLNLKQVTESISGSVVPLAMFSFIFKNTITVRGDILTRPGLRPLFPTPLSCLAAGALQQGSLQRLCQVSKLEKGNILLHLHIYTGGGSFDLEHERARACGIPDGGDTIVLTGGRGHKYVTRWVDEKIIIIM